MKKIVLVAFAILAINLIYISNVSAVIFDCDGSRDDCQAKITAASDGDIITLPPGTFNWDGVYVSWSNKNISIIGAGIDNTNITGSGMKFSIITTTKGSFRVSGISFSGATANQIFNIANNTAGVGNPYTKGWRFDHLSFNYTGSAANTNVFIITGVTWGLIDNCVFSGNGYAIINQYSYMERDGTTGLGLGYYDHSIPLALGSDNAVYFEDNEVNFGNNTSSFIFNQAYGGRVVIRHNIITETYMQNHSARGDSRGGVSFEIYNNTLAGGGFIWPAFLRSGTGVIFNNTITGYGSNNFIIDNQRTCSDSGGLFGRCNGTKIYDGNTAGEYGWPCVDQIGRNPNNSYGGQPSEPLYGWNNGTTATCATGGACDNASVITVNSNFDLCISDAPPSLSVHLKTTGDVSPHTGGTVDYINNGSTPKPGYTPYTYPHPLRGPFASSHKVGVGSAIKNGEGSTIRWFE